MLPLLSNCDITDDIVTKALGKIKETGPDCIAPSLKGIKLG